MDWIEFRNLIVVQRVLQAKRHKSLAKGPYGAGWLVLAACAYLPSVMNCLLAYAC